MAGAAWIVSDDDFQDHRVLKGPHGVFRTWTPELFSPLDRLKVAAQHDVTILIVGETGTGKTTLARLIHDLSPRADKPFYTVACGAIATELIDSELFGHEKGAFTSADRSRQGKFDAAAEGTILLDEIDVLGMMQQAKLLRVLESGEYEAVGSNVIRQSTSRVIAAANVRLEDLIDQRQFRRDLFFRLKQVRFEIPPLRERPRDIVPLTIDFIDECRREASLDIRAIDPAVFDVLRAYSWPGNIRELRNEARRIAMFSQNGVITSDMLSPEVIEEAQAAKQRQSAVAVRSHLAHQVAKSEQEAIEEMLQRHNNNRAATARALGISRVTLYSKLKKYRIGRSEKSEK